MANRKRIGQVVRVNAYVGTEEAAMLDTVATQHQTSASDIIRRALKQYFSLPENITDSKKGTDVA
jgi:hypothetical protein